MSEMTLNAIGKTNLLELFPSLSSEIAMSSAFLIHGLFENRICLEVRELMCGKQRQLIFKRIFNFVAHLLTNSRFRHTNIKKEILTRHSVNSSAEMK